MKLSYDAILVNSLEAKDAISGNSSNHYHLYGPFMKTHLPHVTKTTSQMVKVNSLMIEKPYLIEPQLWFLQITPFRLMLEITLLYLDLLLGVASYKIQQLFLKKI